jgi:sulfotransferase
MAEATKTPSVPAQAKPQAQAGETKKTGKALYFLGGLPRSGSTLIANVMWQNPRFHVTATSGLLSLLLGIRNHWEKMSEAKAMPKEEAEATKLRVLRGAIVAYFANVDRPVVVDKGRGWIGQIPFIEAVLNRKVKIIVPVRDVRDILASFEKISTKNPLKPTAQELGNPQAWETIEGRCNIWFHVNQPVGAPYRKMKDALQKGYADRMHFVDYDDFTNHPDRLMRGIYEFLDEPYFAHDFKNVQQVTVEDDDVWRMPGLHDIRTEVKPQPPSWPTVLPADVAKKFPGKELWKKLAKK